MKEDTRAKDPRGHHQPTYESSNIPGCFELKKLTPRNTWTSERRNSRFTRNLRSERAIEWEEEGEQVYIYSHIEQFQSRP
jgi:hypothetical protein